MITFKKTAKRRGYVPPDITPEQYLRLERKSKKCFGCNGALDETKTSHLHHNHATGEVYGFCHSLCNQAEGMLSKMKFEEKVNFLSVFFPEVFK